MIAQWVFIWIVMSGPQTWCRVKAADDKSGYVKGTGYEFAYTYDADFDNGITP